jgi:hypothetical protein
MREEWPVDILLGIFFVIVGLAITFMGIQVFFAILPILGFVFGFFLGAGGIEAIWGDSFLSTVTGWIVGFVAGLVFGFIAWYWWYAGVLLSAGVFGGLIGTGLASLFEIDNDFVLFVFGLVGFIAAMALAFVLNLPIYLVILNTGVAGATVVVTGALLVFNQIDREELGEGTAIAMINESWWWLLVAFVVAVVGMAFQLMMRATVTLPSDRWEPAGFGTD